MIFTQSELICFNSVLDGEDIFGTHFAAPAQTEEYMRGYVHGTVESLFKKGFLDEARQPNTLFASAADMLKEYKQAKKYLLLNRSRIALGSRFLVCLTPVGEEFDLTRMDKALFLAALLDNAPALKQADEIDPEQTKVQPEVWNNSWKPDEQVQDYYWLQKTDGRNFGNPAICYHTSGELFVYRPVEQILTKCGSSYIRKILIEMLEIPAPQTTAKEEQKIGN